jgi:hypothetical protein
MAILIFWIFINVAFGLAGWCLRPFWAGACGLILGLMLMALMLELNPHFESLWLLPLLFALGAAGGAKLRQFQRRQEWWSSRW